MSRDDPKGSRRLSSLKITRRVLTVIVSLFLGLAAAEGIVRWHNEDYRLVGRMLYYEKVEENSFEPADNPELLFRTKPKSSEYHGRVNINSLGVRGPERPAAKPAGVFRILCYGGSNVFGPDVRDSETWPAMLEKTLNKGAPGRYEVWNMGACAYVGEQMAAFADETIPKYHPDLVILAMSNVGAKAFLEGPFVHVLFENHPRILGMFYNAARYKGEWISTEETTWFLRHCRLYRFILASSLINRGFNWHLLGNQMEMRNIRDIRGLVEKYRDKTKFVFYFFPGIENTRAYARYFQDLDVPLIHLKAEGRPDIYREVHPPAYVYEWYGEEIGRRLREDSLPLNEP